MRRYKRIRMLCLLVLSLSFILTSCTQRPIIRGDYSTNGEVKESNYTLSDNKMAAAKSDKEIDPQIKEMLSLATPIPLDKETLLQKTEGPLSMRKLKDEHYIEWDDKKSIWEMAEPYVLAMDIPAPDGDNSLDKKEIASLAQKLHMLVSMEYHYADNPLEGGYIRFRGDNKDPLTGETLNVTGNVNLEIIVDMNLDGQDRDRKLSVLKSMAHSIDEVITSLPEDSKIALRLTNGEEESIVVLSLSLPNKDAFIKAVDSINTSSGGNIVKAVSDATSDITSLEDDKATNIILVITDSFKYDSPEYESALRDILSNSNNSSLIITSYMVPKDDEVRFRSLASASGGSYFPLVNPGDVFSPVKAQLLTLKDPIKWAPLDEKMLKDLNMQYDSYKYEMKFPDNSERLMLGTLEDLLVEKGYITPATRSALYNYFNDYFTFTDNLEKNMFQDLDFKRAEQLKTYFSRIGDSAFLIRRKTAKY